MAVTFISNGYDTTSTNPYTETAWADAFPSIGSASYGVRGPLDWKVTAVPGQDRTVSIAAGRGWGHGVTDKTTANETLQLSTISSGSRWDLIVVRRDWTPTAGTSKFEKVNGGATMTIPGGRLIGPGNIDDQPLALVQVTSGQTQPTAIIDLRVWSGDGGGLVASHDLARSYLDAAGTRLHINGVDWIRRVGANDVAEWARTVDSTIPTTSAGWSLTGSLLRTPASAGAQVNAAFRAVYGGGTFALNSTFIAAFTLTNTGFLPVGADAYGYFMLRAAGTRAVKADCAFTINPAGEVYVRTLLGQAATTVALGDELAFNTVWNA